MRTDLVAYNGLCLAEWIREESILRFQTYTRVGMYAAGEDSGGEMSDAAEAALDGGPQIR